jgi:hypothetical protein
MSELDKRRERLEQEGTNEIMKKAQEKAREEAEKNKELCTLRSLTICGDDLDTLEKCLPLDDSGIINHIITMVKEHTEKK